ncbi:hypothetical protein [Thiolapillus sp.]|uniref:hypothetical protein n=1 Tax=Thiolapillus sp. TaxID=2017437 RepID=UPI0025F7CBEF|nr:hypothetical protein [Thiolapillus sp.]
MLSEGLTVKGKPVKDHNEVIGHARAIDILYSLLERPLLKEDMNKRLIELDDNHC